MCRALKHSKEWVDRVRAYRLILEVTIRQHAGVSHMRSVQHT